jgi:translation elongation factor EF-1beta
MRMSLHLTATELAELGERIEELLQPYVEGGEARPGTLPVAFGLFAVPTRLPADDERDVR